MYIYDSMIWWVTFQHGRLAPEPFRCQDHFLMYQILELKWLVLKDLACETISG